MPSSHVPVHQKQIFLTFFSLLSFAFLLGVLFWVRRHFFPVDFSAAGLIHLRGFLLSYGFLTPLVFCLAYGLRSVFYIPEPMLMMLAGFLVGPILGPGLIMVGMLLSCVAVYTIATLLYRGGGERFLRMLVKIKFLNISQRKFLQILWVWRMLPLFPFSTLTYGAFVLKVPFKKFILAMAFGVIPSAIFYSYLGCFVLRFFEPNHLTLWSFSFIPSDWHVLLPFAVGIILWGSLGFWIQWKWHPVPK